MSKYMASVWSISKPQGSYYVCSYIKEVAKLLKAFSL